MPPLCGTIDGTIASRPNGTASLELSNFYCNWAVIGNVISNVKLSIDDINVSDRSFTGYYRIAFYGTGNATGSGYFKAQLVDRKPPNQTSQLLEVPADVVRD